MRRSKRTSGLAPSYPPYWDLRYVRDIDKLSSPTYDIKCERNVRVEMRDGVELCVDVFRPESSKKFPAIFATSAYSKSIQSLPIPPQPHDSVMFNHEVESCDSDFFVRRGYAFVIGESRGVGNSDGEYRGFFSPQEQTDAYDVIEWIATQTWCTGKVGMIGLSYFGAIQELVAILQPPHLSAIFPIETHDDWFLRACPGGMPFSRWWGIETAIPAHTSVLDSERYYSKYELDRRIKALRKSPDISRNSHYFSVLEDKKHAAFADFLLNPSNGPFWADRSPRDHYDRIKIPVYEATLWSNEEFTRGSIVGFNSVKVPKKLGIFGWRNYYMLPMRELNYEALRWFDHWLKGIDTGIMEEPPIKLFVTGIDRFRYEYEWPLARTRWTKMYLHPFGRLEESPPEDSDLEPDGLVHYPSTTSYDVDSLVYSTAPVTRPTEITGPIAAYIYASIDQEDANFITRLYDSSPGGGRFHLESGYLRVAYRKTDETRSHPWEPYHSYSETERMVPNAIYELAISIHPTSRMLLPNHKIEFEITTEDRMPVPRGEYIRRMEVLGHFPRTKLTFYRIYRDSLHKSHLVLPIIPESTEESYVQPLGDNTFVRGAGTSYW